MVALDIVSGSFLAGTITIFLFAMPHVYSAGPPQAVPGLSVYRLIVSHRLTVAMTREEKRCKRFC